jgi:hypothetical protein
MRRGLSFLLLLVVILTTACGSAKSTRPATIAQPDLDAGLATELFFGSGTQAPANIDVRVTNRATVPITLRRVEIDSPGMGQYVIGRTIRDFRETIAPGETKVVAVFATAYAQTTRRPSEPLQLRAIIEFEAGEARWREILMARE